MGTRTCSVAIVVLGLVALGCSGPAPTAPDPGAPTFAPQEEAGTFSTSMAGKKTPITGTLNYVGEGPTLREFTTPSGIYHFWEGDVVTIFDGSIQGLVTFTESGNFHPNGLSFRGPFKGEVTWNGVTGTMSGMWTTLCTFPDGEPGLPECGGTFNAKGSWDLRGVNFHIVWGPGFYPFSYSGFAIDNRK
jgi:hypothetical protein